jgi:hypothetical protein
MGNNALINLLEEEVNIHAMSDYDEESSQSSSAADDEAELSETPTVTR